MGLIYSLDENKKFDGKKDFIDITHKLHYFLKADEISFLINFKTSSSDYMSLFSIYYKESLIPDFSININKGYIVITTKERPDKSIILNSKEAYCDGKEHKLLLLSSENELIVYVDDEMVIKERILNKYCDFAYVGFATIGRGTVQDEFSNYFNGEITKFEVYDYKYNYEIKTNKKYDKSKVIFKRGLNGSCNYRIPSLITTSSGTLIASIDARVDCPGDSPNNIDRVIRISKDNGETWSDVKVIVDHGGIGREDGASAIDCSMIYDEEENKILMIYCHKSAGVGTFNCEEGIGFNDKNQKIIYKDNKEFYINSDGKIVDEKGNYTGYISDELGNIYKGSNYICNVSNGKHREFTQKNTSYLQILESIDDGETWSKPRDLNYEVKEEWMKFFGAGPGTGIQIKSGKYKGRLIFPIYFSSVIGKMYSCCVIYSDDHGRTWHRGRSVNDGRIVGDKVIDSMTMDYWEYQTTESHVVELDNDIIKIFMRNYFDESFVATAISEDGGESWKDVKLDRQLLDPGCQNSIIRVKDGNKYSYIFSNPNHNKLRVQGTLKYSDDSTVTWKKSKLIEPGEYGYSSLTQLKTGEIGVLYEGKDLAIKFKKYRLEELK